MRYYITICFCLLFSADCWGMEVKEEDVFMRTNPLHTRTPQLLQESTRWTDQRKNWALRVTKKEEPGETGLTQSDTIHVDAEGMVGVLVGGSFYSIQDPDTGESIHVSQSRDYHFNLYGEESTLDRREDTPVISRHMELQISSVIGCWPCRTTHIFHRIPLMPIRGEYIQHLIWGFVEDLSGFLKQIITPDTTYDITSLQIKEIWKRLSAREDELTASDIATAFSNSSTIALAVRTLVKEDYTPKESLNTSLRAENSKETPSVSLPDNFYTQCFEWAKTVGNSEALFMLFLLAHPAESGVDATFHGIATKFVEECYRKHQGPLGGPLKEDGGAGVAVNTTVAGGGDTPRSSLRMLPPPPSQTPPIAGLPGEVEAV